MNGAEAHAAGLPISACPFPPGDLSDEAHGWRAGWIESEVMRRAATNTLGASDDEYRAAGLNPPRRDNTGRPIASAQPSPWPNALAEVIAYAEATRKAWAKAAQQMADTLSTVHDQLTAAGVLDPPPPPPSQRHRSCPQHGPTTAGMCRQCARGR